LGRANGVGATEAGVDLRLVDVARGVEARRATVLLELGEGRAPDVRALVRALFADAPQTNEAVIALRPSDARRFVDGLPVPTTTSMSLQKVVGLLPGPHVVRAEAAGFHAIEQRLEVRDDAVTALELSLEPLAELTVE